MPKENKASKVTDLLNSLCFDYDGFCRDMVREHRTLQQQFTKLCIEWIKTCADEDYRHDGRNERSHFIAKEIVTAYNTNHTNTSEIDFKDIGLPLI